jgi:hypothetical protein
MKIPVENPLPIILDFLADIGIPAEQKTLDIHCFLPGTSIQQGTIFYDKERMLYPGDLLHEAGHIACTASDQRPHTGTDALPKWPDEGNEIAAVIWSFAACKYLNLPSEVVFHPGGYKGESDWLIENFEQGSYIGLPLLVWLGLCDDPATAAHRELAFPHMKKWLAE